MEYILESTQSGAEILSDVEVYDDAWCVCVCVVVYIVTDLYCRILSGAGDIWQMFSSYIELYGYAEVYYRVWSILVCNCVGCDKFFCKIFSSIVYRPAWIINPNRQAGAKTSSYVESYDYVKTYDGNSHLFLVDFIIFSHINVKYERTDVSHISDYT